MLIQELVVLWMSCSCGCPVFHVCVLHTQAGRCADPVMSCSYCSLLLVPVCPACRQVEALIQELVVLVQRSEEYTYFLTSHMRDAVNRDTEKQQAAAAQRQSHLQRRLSGAQPDTPATRDQQGMLMGSVLCFSLSCGCCITYLAWGVACVGLVALAYACTMLQ